MYYLFFAEVNFLTCIPDEGAPNRTACLPDEMCFTEPERCIVGLSLLSPVEEDPSSTDESERDEESDSAESDSGL